MLYQLHWQFIGVGGKTEKTEMRAQKEIKNIVEMKEWQEDVEERNPLPEGAVWMMCGEKSKHFVMAVEE